MSFRQNDQLVCFWLQLCVCVCVYVGTIYKESILGEDLKGHDKVVQEDKKNVAGINRNISLMLERGPIDPVRPE